MGKIGRSSEEEVFAWDSSLIVLPTYGLKNAVLVFHISNFGDRYPGFTEPIKFGSYSVISAGKDKDTIIFIILAGYLLVAGAFFLSLYLFYSKEKKTLYFGLICVVFSVRICCYDEFLMNIIVPNINPTLLFKVGYATFSLGIILVSLFVQELFNLTKHCFYSCFSLPSNEYFCFDLYIFLLS